MPPAGKAVWRMENPFGDRPILPFVYQQDTRLALMLKRELQPLFEPMALPQTRQDSLSRWEREGVRGMGAKLERFSVKSSHIRSFPRKRESSFLALGPRFRGDERHRCFGGDA
jgi:hypothetical protein